LRAARGVARARRYGNPEKPVLSLIIDFGNIAITQNNQEMNSQQLLFRQRFTSPLAKWDPDRGFCRCLKRLQSENHLINNNVFSAGRGQRRSAFLKPRGGRNVSLNHALLVS